MSLIKKTISGAFIRISSLIIKGGLQLFVLSFFARYISPEEFGIISIVTSFMVFVVLFSEIGLGPALIQKQDINNSHINGIYVLTVLLAFIIYSLIYIISPFIAYFFEQPLLSNIIRIAGLSIIFTSFGIVPLSLLRKDLNFKKIMFIDIFSFVISYCILGVVMALKGYGIWAYICSILFQSIISALLFNFSMPLRKGSKKIFNDLKYFFNYAKGLTIEKFFNTLGRQGDNFVTGKLLGMNSLGIYGRAFQLMDIPNQYLGQALDNVLFPALATKQNNIDKIRSIYLKGITIINLVMFPASLFLILFSSSIIELIFGPGWSQVSPIFQLLCILLPFRTSVKITDSLVRALGAFYYASLIKITFALAVIFFTIIGNYFFQLPGIALGVNCAVLINYILMTMLSKRLTEFTNKEYFNTYTPGLILVSIIGIPCACLYIILQGRSPLIILFVSMLVTFTIVAIFLLIFPALFGNNWQWFLSNLINYIPSNSKIKYLNGLKSFLIKKVA